MVHDTSQTGVYAVPVTVPTLESAALTLQDPPPAERHPVATYLARLSPASRQTMLGALEVCAQYLANGRITAHNLPWHQLRYQHMNALRVKLADTYAPATANRYLTAVRCVLKECWRLSYVSLEDQTRACDVQAIRGERLPKGRALSHIELTKLFEACAGDLTPRGRRDAALIALLYGAGLRRSEAVNLDTSDYDEGSGALKIWAGKGNKDRLLYAGNGSADTLRAWLKVRGDTAGPLLLPVSRGGHIQSRRLTDKAIAWILELRAEQAGVKIFSPHDLRHSYISHMLSAGVDLPTVSALAGHASVTTTAKYDRRGDDQKRKAASLLVVPYVAP